jgi:hypothetical protein
MSYLIQVALLAASTVELAGYLFIGSYTGDRIIRVFVGN